MDKLIKYNSMKKILLFAATLGLAGFLQAQDCHTSINNGADSLGFNPNPFWGSVQGVAYDEVNTLVLPKKVDNTLTPTPGDSIQLAAIKVISVTGFPAGYTWEAWSSNNAGTVWYDVMATSDDTINVTTANLTRACLRVVNPTPPGPTNSLDGLPEIDSVQIDILVGAWVYLAGPSFPPTDLSGGASGQLTFSTKLPIKSAVYASIEDEIQKDVFAVYSNTPNPANESTRINFSTITNGNAVITMMDATGRIISSTEIGTTIGFNSYELNTSGLATGTYLYSVTHGGKTITKRMIVAK